MSDTYVFQQVLGCEYRSDQILAGFQHRNTSAEMRYWECPVNTPELEEAHGLSSLASGYNTYSEYYSTVEAADGNPWNRKLYYTWRDNSTGKVNWNTADSYKGYSGQTQMRYKSDCKIRAAGFGANPFNKKNVVLKDFHLQKKITSENAGGEYGGNVLIYDTVPTISNTSDFSQNVRKRMGKTRGG